jgi:hypothetical protein
MKASLKNWSSLNKITCLSLLNQKTLTCLLVFLLCFNGKGQPSCSTTGTLGDIFYPNTVSTPTYATNGNQYLCGPNTVVYDTISIGCLFVHVNTGSTLFYNKGCPQTIGGYVWLKNNSTLNILAGSPGLTVYYEPLATINNTAAIAINSVACASITFPTINCATGINEQDNQEAVFLVYPNPVSNNLFIPTEQYFKEGGEIEITNTLGQTVLRSQYKSEVDVSQLTQGCYFLKLKSNNQQFNSKFIKE